MSKTKCYSVRLQSLRSISDKAYEAVAFDGSKCILPKSQVFGHDFDVLKSEAYWIAAWILETKQLQYSRKKEGWYNPAKGRVEPAYNYEVEKHVPTPIEARQTQPNEKLLRP